MPNLGEEEEGAHRTPTSREEEGASPVVEVETSTVLLVVGTGCGWRWASGKTSR